MKATARLKELREKEDSELAFDIQALQKELFDLRFKSSSEGLAKPSRIRAIRREVARLRTLLRERELSIHGSAPRK
ncbi:MAG: 50S ribosomal protein L29 [Planctomycetota bacterium]